MQRRYYLASAIILILSLTASGQFDERDMEKEALIWEKLQSIAPRSVETFKEATAALDAGDYEKSARLYEEVLKKAPEFDPVMRRLGLSLVQIGREQEGLSYLERAVGKNRSPENLISLAQYLAFTVEGERKGSRTSYGGRWSLRMSCTGRLRTPARPNAASRISMS
jgi:tetratricopeptide (TPR) repeat protein